MATYVTTGLFRTVYFKFFGVFFLFFVIFYSNSNSQKQSPPPLPPPDFDSPSTSLTINSLTLDDSFASSTPQNAIANNPHQQEPQQRQHEINQNIPQLSNANRRRSIANLSLQLKEHSFNNKNDAFNSQKCYSTIANKLEQR